ncbi:putative L-ascorbate oxidase [Auriculariales sp. MPI-PUGE-AT-0066]|nr:putative L-ascorbate oxidase [Auriculariales sp. MPI-PUGE-AT-0066]
MAFVYTWPDPRYDLIESARWQQLGHNDNALNVLINPCDLSLLGSGFGRSTASDWIRTAFHDMATFDKGKGTGGLDASLRFPEEQARDENKGTQFALTMAVFMFAATPNYISFADGVALGAVLAMEQCGGPEIPYRHGRVDALTVNDAGVPQPQEDLASHINTFARSGFNKEEMIGLIACGHSFGGVQNKILPEIVPPLNDPNNTESTHFFDSTGFHFDNAVATEYISGTTKNPLVVGANDTFNSDKRIFSSDGNKTMAAFARSPQLFSKTCSNLFARMIDTVPKGVKLTDVLEPLPIRPDNLDLVYVGDGTLRFGGEVRIWNNTAPTTNVRMTWTNRDGRSAAANSAQLATAPGLVSTAVNGRYKSAWYSFNRTSEPTPLTLKEADGLKALSFEVWDSTRPGSRRTYNQGGLGYRVRDEVIWAASTCGSTASSPASGRFDVAIRRDIVDTIKRVWIETLEYTNEPGLIHAINDPRIVQVDVLPPAATETTGKPGAYVVWSVSTDVVEAIAQTQAVKLYALTKNGERIDASGLRIIQGLQPACAA